jgi:hypothetical protein
VKQYSESDVARILGAYRSIFPRVPHKLADCWGHGRTRPWSQLTSNFHAARFEQSRRCTKRRAVSTPPFANLEAKGAALRAAAHEVGVGYSLGINAWADNLLHQTFQEGLTSLTIVLAHDWYPIATVDRRGQWRKSDAPLRMDDNLLSQCMEIAFK